MQFGAENHAYVHMGMQLHILTAQTGEMVPEDPYLLPPGQFPTVKLEEQRGLVKLLVLMALNARDVPSACATFREGAGAWSSGKEAEERGVVEGPGRREG